MLIALRIAFLTPSASKKLTIASGTDFTGLTLEPPQGQSELEKRFLEPLVERLYSDRPGRYSLGSNPEVTLDLMPYFKERIECQT